MRELVVVLTWYHIPRVHSILVLDEAEPIHELHFGDNTSAMGLEVFLDIFLCDWRAKMEVSMSPIEQLSARVGPRNPSSIQ